MIKKRCFDLSYFYWGIFFLYCIYTILTLENFQFPWGDEAFYLDMTINFKETGKLITNFDPTSPMELNRYGPLYFWINAKLISIFGINVWAGRILNLLLGLAAVLFSILTLQKLNVRGKYILLFLLFIITDVNYNFIMHSGRMDLCAVGFITLAVYLFFFGKQNSFIKYIICGVLIGFGVLFASRLLMMLPLLLFFPLFGNDFIEKKKLLINLIFVFLGFVSIYSLWVFKAFGGYIDFFDYFFKSSSQLDSPNETFVKYYMLNGGAFNKFFRDSYISIPRYLLFYGLMLYFFFSKNIKREKVIIFIALISLSFILLVSEIASEAYIAMVKPFIYIIIVYTLANVFETYKYKLIIKYLMITFVALIFSIQTMFSVQKIFKIMVTQNELSKGNIEQKVTNIIPPGSLVASDPRYFYICARNKFKPIFEMPDYTNFKPDYIITKDISFNDTNFVLVGDLEYDKWKLKSDFTLLQKIYDITSIRNNYSTNAYIYKKKMKSEDESEL